MKHPTNDKLIERWRGEPAPLLPLLHAFQERDGYLSEEAIRETSAALRIPLADLYGTVTFYHHFSRHSGAGFRVCTGPVCRFRGGLELLEKLGDTAHEMPCAGRCDDPIPVIQGETLLIGTTPDTLVTRTSPLPPPNPGGVEECVFASIRADGQAGMGGYCENGGYEALSRAVLEMEPGEVIRLISESELAGRGGAGFPTGRKWQAVRDAPGNPKTIVCNADEGEPGCFKDRVLMDHDPHAVIEGMILAAYATGATRGFIYLRYEYPETFAILDQALHETEESGFLGDRILERDFSFHLYLRRGAGAYICGEETSLLNSLEGKHPFPRNRPPYPVTHGYEDLPTVVNNVETLASAPPIVRNGPEWYRGLGCNGHSGTKVISLSGDIQEPGNYEVPLGMPLKTLLYDWAGGAPESRAIQAVTMAGLSGGFLAGDDLDVTLDETSIRSRGSFLGAGGIMVFDSTRNMVEVAHNAMSFFAEESCGKCFPCRIGTKRLEERLSGEAGPKDFDTWAEEVKDLGEIMKELSACGLGVAAPLVSDSLLKYFPDRIHRHLQDLEGRRGK